MEAHWEFYLEHEENIRRLARRMGAEQVEELMSEAALRLPRIFECYDGVRSLEGHVHCSLKWYFYKYVTKRGQRPMDRLAHEPPHRTNLEKPLEVQMILSRLSAEHRQLLELHLMHGCTFEEVAAVMGYNNRGAARKAYMEALVAAKGDQAEPTGEP